MRILLWYWGRRGGGAQYTLGLARALVRRAGTTLALSVSANGELLNEYRATGAACDAVPTYDSLTGFLASIPAIPARARRLVAQARDFRADVVVSGMTHLWTPLVAPRLARAGLSYVPVVHDAAPHPGDPGALWDWRLNRELDAARAAIVLSDAVGDAVRARRPTLRQIRLDLPALLQAPPPAPPRPDGAGTRFLFFGRIRAYKGLDLLRDAHARLLATHPDAMLRVVGEGDAEALAPGLLSLPNVTVEPRWVAESDMPALLREADALVLPYREASQSGVVAMAAALGVPVVASAVGGLSEQVQDGRTGLLAAPDPAALADAMARMTDPLLRARLATGAAAHGQRLNDWDAHAAGLLAGLSATT